MTPITALLALRDSTDKQDVARQREAGHAYAAAHGLTIIHEVVDYITGVIPIFDRPGGREILDWIAGKRADAVIFDSISRVAREEHPVSAPMLRSALAHAGMQLHYVDKGRADLSPYGGIIDYIGAVQAGEERKNILRQTSEGRLTHVRAGSVLAFAAPPYGYTLHSEQRQPPGFHRPFKFYWLEINEAEAAIVRRVFDLYVHGEPRIVNGKLRRVPIGLEGIAKRLTDERVPTKGETTSWRRSKRRLPAFTWSATQLRNIIRRETYVGVWHYRKSTTVRASGAPGASGGAGAKGAKGGSRRVTRPRSEWITVEVPAILMTPAGEPDVELWQRAQERRSEMAAEAKRNLKSPYLLRSRVRCARCGRAVGTHFNRSGRRKYLCLHKKKRYGAGACDLPQFDGAELETAVWDWVRRVIINPGWVMETIDVLHEDEERDAALAAAKKRLAEVERDIETLNRAAAQLLSLLGQVDNAFTPEQINNQQRENRRRLDGLRDERTQLTRQIRSLESVSLQVAEFETLGALEELEALDTTANAIAAGLEDLSDEDKRGYLEQLDVRVRLDVVKGDYVAWVSCVLFNREFRVPVVKSGNTERIGGRFAPKSAPKFSPKSARPPSDD